MFLDIVKGMGSEHFKSSPSSDLESRRQETPGQTRIEHITLIMLPYLSTSLDGYHFIDRQFFNFY